MDICLKMKKKTKMKKINKILCRYNLAFIMFCVLLFIKDNNHIMVNKVL